MTYKYHKLYVRILFYWTVDEYDVYTYHKVVYFIEPKSKKNITSTFYTKCQQVP